MPERTGYCEFALESTRHPFRSWPPSDTSCGTRLSAEQSQHPVNRGDGSPSAERARRPGGAMGTYAAILTATRFARKCGTITERGRRGRVESWARLCSSHPGTGWQTQDRTATGVLKPPALTRKAAIPFRPARCNDVRNLPLRKVPRPSEATNHRRSTELSVMPRRLAL